MCTDFFYSDLRNFKKPPYLILFYKGNKWGIYGCLSHQHTLPRTNKSEIIFENKLVAESFFDQHLKSMYSRQHGHGNAWKYHGYVCRRTKLVTGLDGCDTSLFFGGTRLHAYIYLYNLGSLLRKIRFSQLGIH